MKSRKIYLSTNQIFIFGHGIHCDALKNDIKSSNKMKR